MEWYLFAPTTDERTCGAYTQTDGMGPGYNLRGPNSVWNISNLKKPDFEPDFDCFMLDKKAKLTDIISTSIINARGFIVSNNLKTIFDNSRLPSHIYYPVVLLYKKERITNYYWLHFIEDNTKDIDFRKSEFELTHPLPFFRTESVILNNKELSVIEANKAANPDFKVFPRFIQLNKSLDADFLIFEFLYNKCYISEKLYNDFKTNNISGIDFTPNISIS
ncbi:MAG: hypothetical protein KIT80_09540 [Chitinophagaceae bacterium]|nr:hypothetical protein [Chitinophagaceae bacterium]MCW5927142.1 hypothetical protein [Chitinophagaceae bacterium]